MDVMFTLKSEMEGITYIHLGMYIYIYCDERYKV